MPGYPSGGPGGGAPHKLLDFVIYVPDNPGTMFSFNDS